jgi:MHS family citrate/tricarballylate:H+ symporter-like MFS transporter
VILTAMMPADALDAYGWRIAFLLGAVTVPFGLWLRTNLPETLHAPDPLAAPAADASRLALARTHWRTIALGLVMLASVGIGSYVFVYIVTYAQDALHMSARAGFVAETGGNVAAVGAVLLGGWLSDRFGRWPVNVFGNLLLLILVYPTFAWITGARSDLALIVGVTGLTGVACLTYGSVYAALAESLPKGIRGGGFGTIYSVAMAAFGGTTQLVATWLIHLTGSAMALAWYLIGAAAIGQVALMLMPESAPRRLARMAARAG